jgi:uncharacterized membrane protein YhaH (DUF805 family)
VTERLDGVVRRGAFIWLAAIAIALVVGWGAAAAVTALVGPLLGSVQQGSSANAVLQLVGYLTWVLVALVVSALVLRRMGDR